MTQPEKQEKTLQEKINRFAQELVAWQRLKPTIDRHNIAHIARVSARDVENWENGLDVPLRTQWSRLKAAHHAFSRLDMPRDQDVLRWRKEKARERAEKRDIERKQNNSEIAAVVAKHTVEIKHPAPPTSPTPSPPSELQLGVPSAWGLALERVRERDNYDRSKIVELLKGAVDTSPTSIWRWERHGGAVPQEAVRIINEFWPELAKLPPPRMHHRMAVGGKEEAAPPSAPPTPLPTPAPPQATEPTSVEADELVTQPLAVFILNYLKSVGGQARSSDIFTAGAPKGFTEHALKKVKEALSKASLIRHIRVGGYGSDGHWVCALPEASLATPIAPEPEREIARRKSTESYHEQPVESGTRSYDPPVAAPPASVGQLMLPDRLKAAYDYANSFAQEAKEAKAQEAKARQGAAPPPLPNPNPARIAKAANAMSPIRLPRPPAHFQAIRRVSSHAVDRFLERYLRRGHRYSRADCEYLIDWLVANSLKEGWIEHIDLQGKPCLAVALPSHRPYEMFWALVALKDAFKSDVEVVVSIVPEVGERRSGKASEAGGDVTLPLAAFGSELVIVKEQINRVKVTMSPAASPRTQLDPETARARFEAELERGRPPSKPVDDPAILGQRYGEAIAELRRRQAPLATVKKRYEAKLLEFRKKIERQLAEGEAELKKEFEHELTDCEYLVAEQQKVVDAEHKKLLAQ